VLWCLLILFAFTFNLLIFFSAFFFVSRILFCVFGLSFVPQLSSLLQSAYLSFVPAASSLTLGGSGVVHV